MILTPFWQDYTPHRETCLSIPTESCPDARQEQHHQPALFAEPLQHERKVHASSDESAELLGSVVTEPSLVKVEARLR